VKVSRENCVYTGPEVFVFNQDSLLLVILIREDEVHNKGYWAMVRVAEKQRDPNRLFIPSLYTKALFDICWGIVLLPTLHRWKLLFAEVVRLSWAKKPGIDYEKL